MRMGRGAGLSVAVYIGAIILVNWLFAPSQLVPGITVWSTSLGDFYLANLLVGFVFVLRDYAQREIGHRVLIATLAAGALTYLMVDPAIAMASVAAFMISETVDWAVYSLSRRPLQARIILSSLLSAPIDTLVFQHMAGYLSPAAFSTEIISKALGVIIIWYLLRMRLGNAPPEQRRMT